MRNSIAVAAFLFSLYGWTAVAKPNRDAPRVVAYLDSGAVRMSGTSMIVARLQASELFAAAGIRLEWREGDPRPDANGARVVGIQFVESPAIELTSVLDENAVAFARPHAPGLTPITVLWDRVRSLLQPYGEIAAGKILGHILAHELCHILEGEPRHSQTGLMKAVWSVLDYGDMISIGLPFAPEDVELMRAAIAPLPLRMVPEL
jgi:hypothetical protein